MLSFHASSDTILRYVISHQVDTATGSISSVVGNKSLWVQGDYDFKQTYSGDGGPAVQAGLSGPSDIAFDVDGNLFISD